MLANVLVMGAPSFAAPPPREPFTQLATLERPASFDPDQGTARWEVQLSSDGRHAWAVATVTSPPPVYRPPGTPGYQPLDYVLGTDDLILWRRVAYAVEYDLGAGTARVCDTEEVDRVAPTGAVRPQGYGHEHATFALDDEMLWTSMQGEPTAGFDPEVRARAKAALAECRSPPESADGGS